MSRQVADLLFERLIGCGVDTIFGFRCDCVDGAREGQSCRNLVTRRGWTQPGWVPNPRTSVVDKTRRTHDLSNLLVCDESVLTNQGNANPGLTIQALAARTADYLFAQGESIFTRKDRDMMQPVIGRDPASPGIYGRGDPRLSNLGWRNN